MTQPNFIRLTDEQVRARKRRNLALAGGLIGFIVLVFLATMINLKRNVEARKAVAVAAVSAPATPAAQVEGPAEVAR